LHAVFLWWGDILTTYAIAGLFIFPLRKLRPGALIAIGCAIILAFFLLHLWWDRDYPHLAAVTSPDSAYLVAPEPGMDPLRVSPELGRQQIVGFTGGFMDALRMRTSIVVWLQTDYRAQSYTLEALGLMVLGMGLFRSGFFTLGWRTGRYLMMMAAGYLVALPVSAALTWAVWKTGFQPAWTYYLYDWQIATWTIMGLAHASALLLLIRLGAARGLVRLLAAAGRMALSNYLMSSLITTLVFCGFGLGLYGKLERAQLLWVVAGVWAFILAWSAPWLSRFHYGPFEWLWRSLARGKIQPFRKRKLGPDAKSPAVTGGA
jgi:uncharacterized protein